MDGLRPSICFCQIQFVSNVGREWIDRRRIVGMVSECWSGGVLRADLIQSSCKYSLLDNTAV